MVIVEKCVTITNSQLLQSRSGKANIIIPTQEVWIITRVEVNPDLFVDLKSSSHHMTRNPVRLRPHLHFQTLVLNTVVLDTDSSLHMKRLNELLHKDVYRLVYEVNTGILKTQVKSRCYSNFIDLTQPFSKLIHRRISVRECKLSKHSSTGSRVNTNSKSSNSTSGADIMGSISISDVLKLWYHESLNQRKSVDIYSYIEVLPVTFVDKTGGIQVDCRQTLSERLRWIFQRLSPTVSVSHSSECMSVSDRSVIDKVNATNDYITDTTIEDTSTVRSVHDTGFKLIEQFLSLQYSSQNGFCNNQSLSHSHSMALWGLGLDSSTNVNNSTAIAVADEANQPIASSLSCLLVPVSNRLHSTVITQSLGNLQWVLTNMTSYLSKSTTTLACLPLVNESTIIELIQLMKLSLSYTIEELKCLAVAYRTSYHQRRKLIQSESNESSYSFSSIKRSDFQGESISNKWIHGIYFPIGMSSMNSNTRNLHHGPLVMPVELGLKFIDKQNAVDQVMSMLLIRYSCYL